MLKEFTETELGGHIGDETLGTNAPQTPSDGGQENTATLVDGASVGPAETTELGGLNTRETLADTAPQTPSDGGHLRNATLPWCASVGPEKMDPLVAEITAGYKRYAALRRTSQRVEGQAMALCRSWCAEDKVAGAKMYRSPTPEIAVWLQPYRELLALNAPFIAEQEKVLSQLASRHPINAWTKTIPGLSARQVALIIGACGRGPGEFRSVSALWKRMGLAVIDGARQRKVAGAAAIEHGYSPVRRALMWNICETIIKAQVRNPKGEDGKSVAGAHAIGPLGQVYIDRKVVELTKTDAPYIAEARARRYTTKRLLRQLWVEWRKCVNTGGQ